jgi:sulfite reductase (NADPH) hemoprotein beta-component
MYQYTDFDRQFIQQRAAQYRDQLTRRLNGQLSEEEFRPLRLQNGWYVQRYAPMLRVAVPYGELNSAQLRVLARIAREFDRPDEALFQAAQAKQDAIGGIPAPALSHGYAHFTTRQNLQYNWIPLEKSADVMDLLASVNMHGIQTSGNCIRNITADERAGVAVDEIVDPRAFAEILRQWSTLHPEFAFLPRKFKIAISGAQEDRAATAWHDVGLQVHRNAAGEVGFRVMVGGGMGRTPHIGSTIREHLPASSLLSYMEAILRVYNRYGRRDNMYKARIKILVAALGIDEFRRQVDEEWAKIDQAPIDLPDVELARIRAAFTPITFETLTAKSDAFEAAKAADPALARFVRNNVRAHKQAGYAIVEVSLKASGATPGATRHATESTSLP